MLLFRMLNTVEVYYTAIISKPRLVRGLLIMMRGVGFEP